MQESSKYGLPEDFVIVGFDNTPVALMEIRTLAERPRSSESVISPTGVFQAPRTAFATAVAQASPCTPWVEVPSSEPVSEP